MIVLQDVVSVGQNLDAGLRAIFFGRLNPAFWQITSFVARANVNFDVGRHFPAVLALELVDHAHRHELPVLLPVRHRDLGANRQVTLILARLQPSIHFAAVRTRLSKGERRQGEQHSDHH